MKPKVPRIRRLQISLLKIHAYIPRAEQMVDGFSVLRAESTGIRVCEHRHRLLDAFDGRSYVLWSTNQMKYLTLGGAYIGFPQLLGPHEIVRAQKQRPVSGADDAE